jgi:glycerol-3-phosphate acyltransferase PlsX
VAVDAMGGDLAPAAAVDGAILAAERGIPVVLVGDRDRIRACLGARDLPVVHAPEHIEMGESALAAVRAKPASSIAVALGLVADGRASSMMSCGHSGAITVEAVRTLHSQDAAHRVALAVSLPRLDGGRLILLDVGANVDSRPEHLCEFAELGVAWARTRGVAAPRVGVLSNGEEPTKGNAVVRATVEALEARGANHVGQVEPGPALEGACEVLVCDGFVGNVAIKAMEAAVALVTRSVGAESPAAVHGGGLLLGVQGVVVIGHGRASAVEVCAAIQLAHRSASAGASPTDPPARGA